MLAEVIEHYPGSFAGLATVALQDPDEAKKNCSAPCESSD
jgi:predicted TIM-barrel fold metal-dependent hydrolase